MGRADGRPHGPVWGDGRSVSVARTRISSARLEGLPHCAASQTSLSQLPCDSTPFDLDVCPWHPVVSRRCRMEGEPGTAFSLSEIKQTILANPGAKVLFLTHGACRPSGIALSQIHPTEKIGTFSANALWANNPIQRYQSNLLGISLGSLPPRLRRVLHGSPPVDRWRRRLLPGTDTRRTNLMYSTHLNDQHNSSSADRTPRSLALIPALRSTACCCSLILCAHLEGFL